jgi:hypothetical protein
MPMPIDLLVEYTDGTMESFYIPLRQMHYEKSNACGKRTVLSDGLGQLLTMILQLGRAQSRKSPSIQAD